MTILVMSSTGKVGQEVVRELHAAHADYRAATKSLERAASLWDFPASTSPSEASGGGRSLLREGDRTRTAAYFSYDEPETFAPVLEGVDRLFLLHPEDQPGRHEQIFAFLDQAIAAGVEQIVFMSALGANLRPTDPLAQVEQKVAQSGAQYTILHPNWFMQNFNAQDLRRINEKNELLLPSGDSCLSLIDTRDIAAVAAKLLIEGVHPGKDYTLTGGEAFTYGEVAAKLSSIANRSITHVSPTPESEIQRLKERTVPHEFVYFMEWLFEDINNGYAAQITSDVQDILGSPPRTFDQYLRDYAHAWQVPVQNQT